MARTLFGDVTSSLRNLSNRSPIALAPNGGRSGLVSSIVRPAGQEAQMRAMGSVGTLFAIVERITTAYSQVEWHLYRSAKSGRDEDRVEVTSHAALDLWTQPNSFMTGPMWREATQQHEELTGEQWWVISRDERSSLPMEMWFARPDRMTPIPDRDTFLSGYVYSSPTGDQVPLGIDDVIMLRRPNPLDPYRGWGPVQTILADLDSARASAEWNANFFRNSAQPGGIVQAEQRLSDDEFNEFRDRWNEQHRGVSNAHRVAVLENGLKWVDRSYSMTDMQFAELRNIGREIIREAFGFPKPMLGTVDDANRANMESAEDIFAKWLIRTRLRRTRQALNTRLLPMYGATGRGLEFDFDDPVIGDIAQESKHLAAQSAAAGALVQAGFEPAGVLSAVGLPEIAFVGAPAAAPKAPTPAASWADTVSGLLTSTPIRNADTDPLEQMQQDHETALTVLLTDFNPIEDRWIDDLGTQIERAIDDDDTAALASLSLDSADAADTVRTALGSAAQQAADRMADEARRQGVTVTAPKVDESLTARLHPGTIVNFGDELNAIATAVASLIASGLAASAAQEAVRRFVPGVSGRDVANVVKGTLRKIKGVFKRDQLGGAVHRAQNTGRIATLEAAPPEPKARWVASEKNDGNTCPPCKAIDGTTFTTLADVTAAYGAGPYHACEGGIRCRGTVTAFWDTTGGTD
ncbi:phage portal protein [Streptomyces sp. NPDC086182]|uniref:phage portal protein n=1 Tax=Streptomyces sp. NPDC086182 TaxID=3155058 RepID=UPI003422A319